ncbi:AGK_G0022580.mRNA.1.CDS.1 [Saccharomyces cerevisiae]|uniref:Protein PXR1 n=2 Tax=Saccharomyces cerevisiae TaxID=4932 RepID=C8Z9H3_YEAS8|nr:Pxr1p [Saccharomyces cerevisiae YJM627]AJR93188.1 Pxr1p [Saccharomyces cerevisiae YJM1129]AJS06440.1 Pxr1p [Saccharomyces cerevisiae YJM1526]AJS08441.1 Pxr1p [Saccharomyces cerevisiae YJM1574]EGA82757.1 Pxr1p [Saccharomyces cerevisiae Lalvin QA23]CAD6469818.1 Y55_G0036000.mRNA.1.CDS.1 [Saccharomyces cerevisiae]CAY80039.1 Pxr1p [Saccharomyces cerevisiae EC1118]
MGLAATRTKQRFGLDPRNTAWSNDTSRFGHQFLEKFGWKPGMGLGLSPMNSNTSHIKVSIKDDNVGLGAKLKRKDKKDEFDNGECAGLDVFQRILGRLNGKESKISEELDTQRKQKIIDGKWGIHFVKGEVLASTWDPKTHKLRNYSNAKKRKREGDDSEDEDDDDKVDKESDKKKHKKHKKQKKDKKKDKKDKKEHKKHKKEEKRLKKEKRAEKTKETKKTSKLKSSESASNIPDAVNTRLSVRSKWIKQKRAALMDSKALNEIFMITND